jgi:hypothetical protein
MAVNDFRYNDERRWRPAPKGILFANLRFLMV